MNSNKSNFFEESTIDNPFADPAIQQITQNASTQVHIEDYTPFNNEQQKWLAYDQVNSQPAVMQVTQDLPVQQTQPQTRPLVSTAELQRKQEELQRKEEELVRREEEMRQNTYNARHNNWPPLPKGCCFQPCFYQDIQVDIPLEFQKIVRHLYYLWIFHTLVMLLNIFGGIIIGDLTIIGMGIFYALLFTPSSYLCWFRPVYKAFRSDSSFNFMVFFFIFFFQFIVTIIQAIGLPSSGTIGIITAINKFKESNSATGILTATFELLIAVGFSCAAAADLSFISKIHHIYHTSGASLAKAQAEFTSEFLRNQHIRSAASNLANAAVQSQTNSNTVNNS